MGLNCSMFLWQIFQLLIGYNLVLPLFIYIIYLLRNKAQGSTKTTEIADYAVIVTAYQQTHNLPLVVDSLLKLNYSNYCIYIVADNCDITNLEFPTEKVILLKPEEVLKSNTKSHFYAIQRFVRPHNRVTIIDSDNLVSPDYLKELDHFFDKGYSAVQGVRDAKNLDTVYACLDAARDIYYHFYDGKILFGAGSSATLSGSGMAFTTSLYCECLGHLEISGAGFDKVLQKEIVARGLRIAFAEKAILYDEKTAHSEQLVKQRARWINTWFKYFKFGAQLATKGMYNFNWNQFLFGLVLLRPPLFIFLILSGICMAIDVFVFSFQSVVWFLGFLLFVVGFVFAMVKSKTDRRIYHSLLGIPKFVFFQLISLFKATNANDISVATQHFHKKEINEFKP